MNVKLIPNKKNLVACHTQSSNYPLEGGGMYIESGNPAVNDNRFLNNQAAVGGAITLNGLAYPDLAYNLFAYNQSSANGGAVANMSMNNTNLKIKYCTYYKNSAGGFGGAVYTRIALLNIEKWQRHPLYPRG